jgi:hypothetical protein
LLALAGWGSFEGTRTALTLTLGALLAALLTFVGCHRSDPVPEFCGDVAGSRLGAEGAFCPNGTLECRSDLACTFGACGSCTLDEQCREGQVCGVDGSCGACTSDRQCGDGSCVAGACLDPIPRFELTMAPGAADEMLADIYTDDYYPARLIADGVDYGECEVRVRGEKSRSYPKKSLRIKFPHGATHPGLTRKIELRAEWADRSFLRTHLGYETFRRLTVIPTPRTRFVNLTLDGDNYGLMLEVERIGSSFLERNGRDGEAPLFTQARATVPGALMPMPKATDYEWNGDNPVYDAKHGGDHAPLVSLIEDTLWPDLLDSPSVRSTRLARTAAQVDVDGQATYLAINAVIQNRDHIANNHHFSLQTGRDGAARWEWYPWDLDTTFGCFGSNGDYRCEGLDPEVWPWSGVAPSDEPLGYPNEGWFNLLAHLTLKDPVCSQRFEASVCEALDSDWWNGGLQRYARAQSQRIRRAVEADQQDRNADLVAYQQAVDELLSFPELRADYLRQEFACT